MSEYDDNQITELIGKTMKSVVNNGNEEIVFLTTDGDTYKLYHQQDCCESVCVGDIIGDLDDLIGNPITMAEEATSDKDPEGWKREYLPESLTWTFYKFATVKGYVTIRWVGESNGYYSESVNFAKM